MSRKLHIGALVDTDELPLWAIELLQRLSANDRLHVQIVKLPANRQTSQATVNADAHQDARQQKDTITRLCHWWLHHRINKPRFNHRPCQASALPEELLQQLTPLDTRAIARQHILLDLCSQQLLEEHFQVTDRPLWSARIHTVRARVQQCLLEQAPLLWVHLWDISQVGRGTVKPVRIATHALPRQSYSLSDLERMYFSCLPAMIATRLNWLALENTSHRPRPINTSPLRAAAFADDCAAAEADARHDFGQQHENGLRAVNTGWRLACLAGHQLADRLRARFLEQSWRLAVHKDPDNAPLALDATAERSLGKYSEMSRERDFVWADPHIQEHDGKHYVFFERMPKPDTPAHIAVARLEPSGRLGEPVTALQTDYHLSYPFVFKHGGDHYMIPESASNHTVRLFKAIHFPDRWQIDSDLICGIDAVDTTLFQFDNKWWMFTNCQTHSCVDERDELHIFYADRLHGPWQAHPMNPVISGVDTARMAGPIQCIDGEYYRLSQYGARRYGYGINICRIDELTTQRYQETAAHRITPEKVSRWKGCHTLAFANGFTITDRQRYRWKRAYR